MNGRIRGFTLVEVLVASTLVVTIMALLGHALRLSVRAQDGVQARLEQLEQRQALARLLRGVLARAVPLDSQAVSGIEPPGSWLQTAAWNERGFELLAGTLREDDVGLFLYRFGIEHAAGQDILRVWRRPLVVVRSGAVGEPDKEGGDELYRCDCRMQFRYGVHEGRGLRWRPRQDEQVLPDLVGLDIRPLAADEPTGGLEILAQTGRGWGL